MCCALPQWLAAFVSSAFAKPTVGRYKAMTQHAPLIDDDGEVRELTAADLRRLKPAHLPLPPPLQKTLRLRVRGPQTAPTKQATTIRLSPDVVAAFKATGHGWQTRIDDALKDWLQTHSPRMEG